MQSKSEENNIPEENSLCVWGDNSFGQLAFDNTNNELKVFIPKMLNFGIHIVEISCGFEHSLLRSIKGELYSVGNNKKGQLGIGKKIKRRMALTLLSFDDSGEKILLASAQGYHNIAYTEFGNLYSWGDNSSGQLGTGDTTPREYPILVTSKFMTNDEESVIAISCGKEHSLILLNTLRCLAWGSNEYFQLGVEAKTSDNVLIPTSCIINSIKGVAAGYEQTLFLDTDGGVWVVGNNDNERLIPGKKLARVKIPTKIELEKAVKRVLASNLNGVITEKNDLFVWGCFMDQVLPVFNPFDEDENEFVESKGSNTLIQTKDAKNPVTMSLKEHKPNSGNKSLIKFRIETAGLGENYLIASDEFGECFAWGFNGNGELGQALDKDISNMTIVSFPRRIDILTPFEVKSIYTGKNFIFTIIAERPNELEVGDGGHIQYGAEAENYHPVSEVYRKSKQQEMQSDQENSEESQKIKSYKNEASQKEPKKRNDREIQMEETKPPESSQNESIEEIKLNMDSHSFDVVRILVFLYESLRFHLIKIIDDTIDVDATLPPELIELIKRQQDIIDDYILRCGLKVELPIDIDNENVIEMKYPEGLKFMEGLGREGNLNSEKQVMTGVGNEAREEITREQIKTQKIRTETIIKLAQLNSMLNARIPDLKKILKIK